MYCFTLHTYIYVFALQYVSNVSIMEDSVLSFFLITVGNRRVWLSRGSGYTLDSLAVYHKLDAERQTCTLPFIPINLTCMSLNRGGKPRNPEGTMQAAREHAVSTQTDLSGSPALDLLAVR